MLVGQPKQLFVWWHLLLGPPEVHSLTGGGVLRQRMHAAWLVVVVVVDCEVGRGVCGWALCSSVLASCLDALLSA